MSSRATAAPAWFQEVADRFTGLELLFDLVFVFCVSQLTGTFRDDPSWTTAATALLVFVPVWWAWTGVTFATDRYPADDGLTRGIVMAAAAGTALIALAVPTVPGAGEVPFALGYALIRLLVGLYYWRIRRTGPDGGRLARFYATGFAALGVVWVASVAVPGPARIVVWAAALIVDFALPQVAARLGRLLPVDRSHLAERCAAFIIIVIGEATVETLALAAEHPLSATLVVVLLASGGLIVALWWGFFDQGSWRRRYEALEGDRSGQNAAVIGAYLHFPVVVGIAGAAGGLQLAVEHADAPLGFPAAAAISIGCSLYLLAMNAMTRVLRVAKTESLVRVRTAVVAGLLLLLAVGSGWHPAVYLAVAVALLAGHSVAGNLRVRTDRRARPAGPDEHEPPEVERP